MSVFCIAQSYTVSPSHTVTVNAPYDGGTSLEIIQTNISTSTIVLKWKIVSNTLLSQWSTSLCDYTACYPNIPDSGTMIPVDPGAQGFIGLNVSPNKIEGMGTLKVYVYEEGKEKEGDTLSWIVNCSITDINKYEQRSLIKIFPNPVSDYLVIDLSSYPSRLNTLCVYNIFGEKMFEKNVNSNTKFEKLDMTSFPKGTYILVIKGNEKKQLTKTFIK